MKVVDRFGRGPWQRRWTGVFTRSDVEIVQKN